MCNMLCSRDLGVRSLEPDEKNAARLPLLLWQTAKGRPLRPSIEADPDLAEIEPLFPFLVGDEVLFAQALVREARVVLIDKDRFHHAGAAEDFDMLRGRAADLVSADRNRLLHLTPAPHLAVAIP